MARNDKNMKVAIIVDNPLRDLNGVVLLAYQLILQHCTVYIVPMYQQSYDIPLIQPDLLIVNYIRPNNAAWISTYKKMGIKIAVLDTEGGILSSSGQNTPENLAKIFALNGWTEYIDLYFFWGIKLYEAFLQYSGLAPERLHVTGCPRYDLCHEKWSSLLNFHRKAYLLINTNFSSINPKFTRSVEQEKKVFIQNGWSHEYIERMFTEFKKIHDDYLVTLKKLVAEHKETDFLIRPHPFEDHAIYLKTFSDYKNVTIDGSGDVLNVLKNARLMIHLNCGTAVESLLLGIPALSLEFLNTCFYKQHTPLPSKISYPINNYTELTEALLMDNDSMQKDNKELLKMHVYPWFSNVDGNAAYRIASIIHANKNSLMHIGSKNSLLSTIFGSSKGFKKILNGILFFILGSKMGSKLLTLYFSGRKEKNVPLSEVSKKISDFLTLNNNNQIKISVKHARNKYTKVPLASLVIFSDLSNFKKNKRQKI